MKINLDKQKVIGIAILIIITAMLFNLFIMPQGKQFKATRCQYLSAIELIQRRKAKRKELKALKNQNQQGENRLDLIESRFINENEINFYLKNLDHFASRTKNKLETLDPLERKYQVVLGIREMVVKIALVGRYVSIIDFLDILKTHDKLLSITNVEMKKVQKDEKDLRASFLLTLFVMENES